MDWYLRWGINVAAIVSGATLISCGGLAAFQTGGLSLGAAYAGSALFMAGVKGSVAMWRDEDCSWQEYTKELGVGAAVGTSSKAYIRCVDVAVTKGWLGESVKNNITNAKTSEDILSIENAKQLARTAVIGTVSGLAAQGVADIANAAQSSNFVDDVANAVSAVVRGQDPARLAALLPQNVVPRLLGNVAGVSADVATGASFAERIRNIAPDIQNMLVTRAEEAPRESPRSHIISILRTGW